MVSLIYLDAHTLLLIVSQYESGGPVFSITSVSPTWQ